jgi:hypothetical protein
MTSVGTSLSSPSSSSPAGGRLLNKWLPLVLVAIIMRRPPVVGDLAVTTDAVVLLRDSSFTAAGPWKASTLGYQRHDAVTTITRTRTKNVDRLGRPLQHLRVVVGRSIPSTAMVRTRQNGPKRSRSDAHSPRPKQDANFSVTLQGPSIAISRSIEENENIVGARSSTG